MTADELTEGQRIYVIGDIHGRLDLLTAMLDRVRADISARPHPRPRLVFLGDYMDRGPECRGVLQALIDLESAAELPVSFLLGNHDSYVSATCATRTGTTAPITGSTRTWAATPPSPPTAFPAPASTTRSRPTKPSPPPSRPSTWRSSTGAG
jgi:serine/threonine protein phosphatase 1